MRKGSLVAKSENCACREVGRMVVQEEMREAEKIMHASRGRSRRSEEEVDDDKKKNNKKNVEKKKMR